MSSKEKVIRVPAHYSPRPGQLKAWEEYYAGTRFMSLCWHRRYGKDLTALNMAVTEILTKRPGLCWHVFPTLAQGRKVMWNGTDNEGKPLLSAFPKELIIERNKADMMLRCKFLPDMIAKKDEPRESIYQIVGADNPDSLRGGNPTIVIISEYGDMAPSTWLEIIQPIIMANKGKAIFVFTPKGRNHAYTLHMAAEDSMNKTERGDDLRWFAQILTVKDTYKWVTENGEEVGFPKNSQVESGEVKKVPIINEADLEEIRAQGMDEAKIKQEYFCSFDSSLFGSYFGQQMNEATEEGRISDTVRYNPTLPVHTAWDLGMDDEMVIVFFQIEGDKIKIIECYHNSGETLQHYCKYIKDKPWVFDFHLGPHDLKVRELGAGSRLNTAKKLGVRFNVVPRIQNKEDSISALRALLKNCYFNSSTCAKLIEALKAYKKKWNEKLQCFADTPLHDWSSNFADAMQCMAMGMVAYPSLMKRSKFYYDRDGELVLKPKTDYTGYEDNYNIYGNIVDNNRYSIYNSL